MRTPVTAVVITALLAALLWPALAWADKTCPSCGEAMPDDYKFCENCGAAFPELRLTCPSCGTENPGDAIYCEKCGAGLREPRGFKVCPECGAAVSREAEFCKKCGARYVPDFWQIDFADKSEQAYGGRITFIKEAYAASSNLAVLGDGKAKKNNELRGAVQIDLRDYRFFTVEGKFSFVQTKNRTIKIYITVPSRVKGVDDDGFGFFGKDEPIGYWARIASESGNLRYGPFNDRGSQKGGSLVFYFTEGDIDLPGGLDSEHYFSFIFDGDNITVRVDAFEGSTSFPRGEDKELFICVFGDMIANVWDLKVTRLK